MTIHLIPRPSGLGAPLGRYSHVAVAEGTLVAVAGQVGVDEEGQLAGHDLATQARQAYTNLGTALAAAGCGLSDVLKMTTYLVGAALIPEFMQARSEIFARLYPTGDYPPNTLVMVSALVDQSFLIEVEAFAVRG